MYDKDLSKNRRLNKGGSKLMCNNKSKKNKLDFSLAGGDGFVPLPLFGDLVLFGNSNSLIICQCLSFLGRCLFKRFFFLKN